MKPKRLKTPLLLKRSGSRKPLADADSVYFKMIHEVEDYSILFMDPHGIIKNSNKGSEKINGYTSKEIIGKSFRIFFDKDDLRNKFPEEILKEAATKGKAVYEGWRIRKDGSTFWGSIVITSIHNNKNEIIGFTKITRDLTERKRMEESMLKAIVNAQEKERNEISEELHDNVSQILTTSKLLMEAASREYYSKFLQSSEENLNHALEEIRNISHRLNPAAVLVMGLPDAIRDLADTLKQLDRIKISFSCRVQTAKISPEVQLALFRIVQEQLNNIMKHSGASFIKITLEEHRGKINLLIADNGKGFKPDNVKRGLGLQNIFYRAELYEGTAHIVSSPGQGCIIKIVIPLNHNHTSSQFL